MTDLQCGFDSLMHTVRPMLHHGIPVTIPLASQITQATVGGLEPITNQEEYRKLA